MKRDMRNLFLALGFAFIAQSVGAQRVNIDLMYDQGSVKQSTVTTAEQNLSALTTEINAACQENRPIDTGGISMTDFARKAITTLWKNIHFQTTTTNISDKLWVFHRNRMMQVNHIPFCLSDDSPLDGDRQDAVVEFDLTGRITDFRFSVDSHAFESMENQSSVADLEEQAIIKKYVERFRTAYNQKDIDFLNMIFSDDALIITGNVVTVRTPEAGMVQQVKFSKQTKTQYLRNLQRCFARNRWIKVNFQHLTDPTRREGKDGRVYYGVRLRQEWSSANGYHDEGYVFLLWEFPKEGDPIIHVRTWQPEMLNGKKISTNEIFSEVDFVKDLK